MNCYYRAEIGVVLAKNGPPWAENGPPGPPGDPPWDPPGPKMGQKSSWKRHVYVKIPLFLANMNEDFGPPKKTIFTILTLFGKKRQNQLF